METAFEAYTCVACGERTDDPARCPACQGALDGVYAYDAVELDRGSLERRRFESMWRYRELLPLVPERPAGEGATALVEAAPLADELGVDTVQIKDEGRNPTGSIADRDAALAVAGAADRGAGEVGLASTGADGQAVAGAAARAGLEATVVVPSRTGFVRKAMINVHGGEMTVVEGRLPDAVAAYRELTVERGVGAGETPLRHEARKTVAYELLEQRDWTAPDAVVVPAGHGLTPVGLYKGFRELVELGLAGDTPRLYAAQAEGCAPIARAARESAPVEPWADPDTVCGDIEVPDPAHGDRAVDAVEESGGGAVATPDDAILDSAVALAGEGIEATPSAAAAASGAWALAERGAFEDDEAVVILNTAAGNATADVVRSHLMGQGL